VLEQRLRAIPFFRNLPADALEAITTGLQLESYERGTVVFRKGDPSDAMYLVESGQVDVILDGGSVVEASDEPLASLGPGSFVGELGLLLDEPRSATLVVINDAELWALRRTELDALLEQHPAVAIDVTRELGRRLVATNRRVSPPALTRATAVWGEGAPDLAGALVQIGSGRIGVVALRGAPRLPHLPPEVTELTPQGLDAQTIAGWAHRQVDNLDHLLLVLPRDADATARAAVNLAGHLVAFTTSWPGWAVRTGAARRVLRCDGSSASLRRVARWVSGRAVGLALSSGGSKCVAHIGVLRALREAEVEIDAVAGTSGGALAAAGLAFDIPESQMMAWVRELGRNTTFRRFDLNLVPRSALFKGARLRALFDTWFGGRTFDDTTIPMWTVATDVDTGEEVVISDGPVADGMRASMSIPGALNPWPYGGRMLIDGAVVNPMPASVLRDAGIRFVIGSSVAGQEIPRANAVRGRAPHLVQIISRIMSAMEREMIKAQVPLVDVMIRPKVVASSSFDFSRSEALPDEGDRATQEKLAEIRALLGSRR
jgi:NTE family protein